MASFSKFQDTVEQFWTATHNLTGGGHVVNVAIHTDSPTLATDDELADLTQITGTGYTPLDTTNTMTETGGTATWAAADTVVFTAGASDWTSTARYVVEYNDTSTGDKLLADWDYGTTFALLNGETFTVDHGASVATLV